MTRIVHTSVTFVGVVGAYLAYAATVVPLVEPQRRGSKTVEHAGDFDLLPAPESKYAALFASTFPPAHWTRESPPKVIESGQGMFVLQDYETRKDGRITIRPCVIMYFPTPWSRSEGPPPRDVIILESPQGGIAQLDAPLALGQGKKLGRVESAWLTGPIVIHSDMDEPGPADDLEITTHDVVINDRGIWTDAAVSLRLGPHRGSGRTLEIGFLNDTSKGRPDTFNVAGVGWIQLLRDVRLVLQDDEGASGGGIPLADDVQHSALGGSPASQVELTSEGPLRVDVPQRVAQFHRNVEAFFIYPNGPSDRLACENLQITFANDPSEGTDLIPSPALSAGAEQLPMPFEAAAAPTPEATRSGRPGLRPILFVASGQPVTLHSASRQFHARCRQLTFDVPLGRLTLDMLTPGEPSPRQGEGGATSMPLATQAADACQIVYEGRRLESPRIEYTLDRQRPRERLGVLRVSGPGRLTAVGEEIAPEQQFQASWQEGLQLVRQGEEPVLSMFGRPEFDFPSAGRLAAGEVHVWLREVPTAATAPGQPIVAGSEETEIEVVPSRLLARKRVAIDSPQLTGRVDQLEAWFVAADPAGGGTGGGTASAAEASPQRNSLWDESLQDPSKDTKSYYVEADRVQIRALLPNRTTGDNKHHVDITHLTLAGGVLFQEQSPPNGGQPALKIQGDWLDVADAHTSSMVVIARGQPVTVHVDGKTLRGGEVILDQAANRFLVPTPGDLSLTIDHDLENRPLDEAMPLTVSWQGGLQFDGQQVILSDKVYLRTPHEQLHTQKLVAKLLAPVPLSQLESEGQVEFARLECLGRVVVDRHVFDAGGLASQEHAEVVDLVVDRGANKMSAAGPGWLRAVRLERVDLLSKLDEGRTDAFTASRAGDQTPTTAAQRGPSSDTSLSYYRIDFQRSMQGRLDTRDMTFEGQVRCVRGPVASWDQSLQVDGLAQLPEDTIVLNAATLRIGQRQMLESKWHEMEAGGGVDIEGGLGEKGMFTARAARLTYDQRKDLLIFDGGAGMAQITHEDALGGHRQQNSNKIIKYSPSRKELSMQGFGQISGDL